MKTTLLIFGCILTTLAPLLAAPLNIVQLGPDEPINVRFETPEGGQSFDLAHGAASGYFVLPDGEKTLEIKTEGIPDLVVPTGETAHVAVLYQVGEEFLWKLVESEPLKEKWSFKIVNLTGKPLEITATDGESVLAADEVRAVAVERKAQIAVQAAGLEKQTSDAPEPSQVFALMYLSEGKNKLLFVGR